MPEANGFAHSEASASSAAAASNSGAGSTSQKLSFGLLEGHGFGQVAYAQWKAACLWDRSKLGEPLTWRMSVAESFSWVVGACFLLVSLAFRCYATVISVGHLSNAARSELSELLESRCSGERRCL